MRFRYGGTSVVAICLAVLGASLLVPAATAEAASCSAMKSELTRLVSGSGGRSAAAKKWTAAQGQQKKALASAERDASYLGCAANASSQCKTLNGKIKRMRKNLAAIERQLAKSGGNSGGNSKRARQLRRAIAKQGCDATGSQREAKSGADATDKPRSLFARLFAPKTSAQQVSANADDNILKTVKRSKATGRKRLRLPAGGTFRTLCVRTCDGYFFPVSFSTGKSQFANDAARCSEICPASPTELYVYKNPGGDAAQMMSLAGDLYAEQPFAYRYKAEFVDNCSCRLKGQARQQSAWTEVGGSGSRIKLKDIGAGFQSVRPQWSDTAASEPKLTTSPLARQPLKYNQLPSYEDPDTLTNLEKGFNAAASLKPVQERLNGQHMDMGSESLAAQLPNLGIRSSKTQPLATASIPPVFKADNAGFKPAPDREVPVRVVGPEYFVAQ